MEKQTIKEYIKEGKQCSVNRAGPEPSAPALRRPGLKHGGNISALSTGPSWRPETEALRCPRGTGAVAEAAGAGVRTPGDLAGVTPGRVSSQPGHS